MAVLIESESQVKQIEPGVYRKLIHLENMMTAVIDFTNGPKDQPDPPHSHPHEQISYIAEGELFVFIDGEKTHLKKGDLFAIPGGVPHCIQPLSPHVRIVDTFTPIREEFLK